MEKLVDIFTYQQTKFLDCVLGVAGMVPTIAALAEKQDGKTIVTFIGNTFWNVNRILSPFADLQSTPRVYAIKMSMIGLYAVMQWVEVPLDA